MINENKQPFDILLVEDEPADANLIKMALKEGKINYRLHHVLDGVEALHFLHEHQLNSNSTQADLIILDLNMPRMNGKEFLKSIKSDKQLNSIPVVVLTTSDVERDVVASYKLGASGFITKPIDMDQFIKAIGQLQDYWFNLNRLPKKES